MSSTPLVERGLRLTKRFTMLAAPIALLALAGCTTAFRADVSRFQQLPMPQGESFVIVAADARDQGGIEFGQYAQLVAAQMAEEGYRPTSDPAQADLVVTLGYDVDTGRERVRSTGFGTAGFGPWGFWGGRNAFFRGGFAYGFNDPFLYGQGFNDVRSYTVYTSELGLTIDRTADNQRLFEGRARSNSRSDSLQVLVPNLVEALFAEFPGESGERVRVSITEDQTTVRRSRN